MEEIKDKINKGMSIGRIPGKTHKYFTELAKEEFCSDYGMCFKHIVDVYRGLQAPEGEMLNQILNDLRTEILGLKQEIEDLKQEKDKPKRGRLDGRK